MKTITFEEFVEQYKPIKNTMVQDRPWDELMFETFDEELDFVMNQQNKQIWTLITGENEEEYIIPGYHIVDRMGYFITELPFETTEVTVNLNEMITTGAAKYACIDFLEDELGLDPAVFEDKIHDYFASKF